MGYLQEAVASWQDDVWWCCCSRYTCLARGMPNRLAPYLPQNLNKVLTLQWSRKPPSSVIIFGEPYPPLSSENHATGIWQIYQCQYFSIGLFLQVTCIWEDLSKIWGDVLILCVARSASNLWIVPPPTFRDETAPIRPFICSGVATGGGARGRLHPGFEKVCFLMWRPM